MNATTNPEPSDNHWAVQAWWKMHDEALAEGLTEQDAKILADTFVEAKAKRMQAIAGQPDTIPAQWSAEDVARLYGVSVNEPLVRHEVARRNAAATVQAALGYEAKPTRTRNDATTVLYAAGLDWSSPAFQIDDALLMAGWSDDDRNRAMGWLV